MDKKELENGIELTDTVNDQDSDSLNEIQRNNDITETPNTHAQNNAEEMPTRRTKKPSKRKWRIDLITLVIGLSIGVISGFIIGKPGADKSVVNDKVYKGTIYAAAQNHKSASVHFNKLTEDERSKLNEDEQNAIFKSYLLSSRFDKALELKPDHAEEVVNYLNKKGNINMVKNIRSNLPPIAFEKAVIRKNYEQVLLLKDKVEDTELRRKHIVEALVMTGDPKSAVKFVKKHKMTGIRQDMERQFNTYATENEISAQKITDGITRIYELED